MQCECGGPLYFVGVDSNGVHWYACAICGRRYSR